MGVTLVFAPVRTLPNIMSEIEVKLHQVMDVLDTIVSIQKKTVQCINELERNGNNKYSECSFSRSNIPGRGELG